MLIDKINGHRLDFCSHAEEAELFVEFTYQKYDIIEILVRPFFDPIYC